MAFWRPLTGLGVLFVVRWRLESRPNKLVCICVQVFIRERSKCGGRILAALRFMQLRASCPNAYPMKSSYQESLPILWLGQV